MPKWAAELRVRITDLEVYIHGKSEPRANGLMARMAFAENGLADLRSRLGTSTPLIIWNIAVLIALAGIAAKVWGYAPY